LGARKVGLLHRLINDQTLPSILAKMPPNDWHQWAKERPKWMREAIDEAFWAFMDQKWRDALNVAAAEPAGWGTGSGGAGAHGADRRGPAEAVKKPPHATIHVAAAEGRPPQAGGAAGGAYSQMYWGAWRETHPGDVGASGANGQKKGQR
jgi:hypothetical protein